MFCIFSNTLHGKQLFSLLLVKHLKYVYMFQSLSIVTKAKKKNSHKIVHQHKLYESIIVECQWVSYLDWNFLPHVKNQWGVMPLSNELIKINEDVSIKRHLLSGKYTSLIVNTYRREHYLTGIKCKNILNIYVCKEIYISIYIHICGYIYTHPYICISVLSIYHLSP